MILMDCIFCNIANKKIPAKLVSETDLILKAIHIPGGKSPQARKEDAALLEI